jgi:hypothetical protein
MEMTKLIVLEETGEGLWRIKAIDHQDHREMSALTRTDNLLETVRSFWETEDVADKTEEKAWWETPSEACIGCRWCHSQGLACVIPGKTCWKRCIGGMPRITVGDLLIRLGVIQRIE